MAIHYFEADTKVTLAKKRKLSAFIKSVIDKYLDVKSIDINYVFCTDAYLIEKNMQFLNHDTYTDIITFDLSETVDDLFSEIYISVERVKENAHSLNIPFEEELHRVIFHGILHLCGFKDHSEADDQLMREKENECLAAYKLWLQN